MKTKTIKLSRIKISDEMKASLPRSQKMESKYYHYKKYHTFESQIVLDKHNVLVNGYTTYLLANMFQIKKIEVQVI